MKFQSTLKMLAGTVFVLGSMNATASGFGGGWKHDSTGTLYNSNAPVGTSSATSVAKNQGSGFGDGWIHNSNTGTLQNSKLQSAAMVDPSGAGNVPSQRNKNSFGGGWGHDSTGTLSKHM